jgi:hypothetical protein
MASQVAGSWLGASQIPFALFHAIAHATQAEQIVTGFALAGETAT